MGKPGGGLRGPLERSVCSLPPPRTGETVIFTEEHSCFFFVALNHIIICTVSYSKSMLSWWFSLCVQVGIVSVALCAPTVEGSYTSHWRLAHAGEQFGPRVWCSIVVDPLAPAPMMADGILVSPCVTPQVDQMSENISDRNKSVKNDRWINELDTHMEILQRCVCAYVSDLISSAG